MGIKAIGSKAMSGVKTAGSAIKNNKGKAAAVAVALLAVVGGALALHFTGQFQAGSKMANFFSKGYEGFIGHKAIWIPTASAAGAAAIVTGVTLGVLKTKASRAKRREEFCRKLNEDKSRKMQRYGVQRARIDAEELDKSKERQEKYRQNISTKDVEKARRKAETQRMKKSTRRAIAAKNTETSRTLDAENKAKVTEGEILGLLKKGRPCRNIKLANGLYVDVLVSQTGGVKVVPSSQRDTARGQ